MTRNIELKFAVNKEEYSRITAIKKAFPNLSLREIILELIPIKIQQQWFKKLSPKDKIKAMKKMMIEKKIDDKIRHYYGTLTHRSLRYLQKNMHKYQSDISKKMLLEWADNNIKCFTIINDKTGIRLMKQLKKYLHDERYKAFMKQWSIANADTPHEMTRRFDSVPRNRGIGYDRTNDTGGTY